MKDKSKIVMLRPFLVVLSALIFNAGFAQDCKVLQESISGAYDGACKKGLAHGQGTAKGNDTYVGEFKKGLPNGTGTYTWADGTVYKGDFKNGLKEGSGEMTGADGVVTTGFWEKDEYLGKYKEAYNVHYHSSKVTSVRVSEIKKPSENQHSAVFVTITEMGANVFDQNISVEVSVGRHSETQMANRATKINVVLFPYRAVLGYRGETVDIEFYREGAYNVTIDTNMQ